MQLRDEVHDLRMNLRQAVQQAERAARSRGTAPGR